MDLKSPATTITLLKLGAVVGVRAPSHGERQRQAHARRHHVRALPLDGRQLVRAGHRQAVRWLAEPRLNPGAIIALSPALTAEQKAVYNSWGDGRYDPRFNVDGMNARGHSAGVRTPRRPQHHVDGRRSEIAYWNRYVAVTQMHGHGPFTEPRLTPPNVQNPPDPVSALLPALQAYQLSLSRRLRAGAFDAAAAARGAVVFSGAGNCATCHIGTTSPTRTRLHAPTEVVSEPEPNGGRSFASRSATKQYRTTPLRGLWRHAPYFHNGVAATLEAVVELYD